MKTIAHRELRNNSGEILRGVEVGETYMITNNGKIVATLAPVNLLPLAGVRSRPPSVAPSFADIARVPAREPVTSVLDDLRGDR
ncbi:type II toxin-antitoxin system Phd/YefM family antitoxin [Subtercola endophyticus]|uniref:type II toxin-antitoxin system Phd/YefM family antitoxin n=1 Tax=Subtercola endophyticus TaxID=2895559 RepID=UPI001E3CEC11|nr:type II toxin-antitoxin system prevent-host-death family antitoxin [Subtercola endophyticus]UFS58890.1 type II toxin-antitoxin system prevent-host-death family antitoxin [Subtercola endophyticus]